MLSDMFLRLRSLIRRGEVEHEIDEELRFHLDRQIAAYEKQGVDHAEAVRRARIEFGGLDQVKEDYRDALGVRLADDLRRDLRLAIRSLGATPVVTAVAVLSLALAIGANTAIFSIINSLLLRALPVTDPVRLVHVTDTVPTRLRPWTYPIWEQFEQRPQLFEAIAAWSFTRFNLAAAGETQFVDGLWASGTFFGTLGVPAVLGRTFSDVDDQRGGGPDGPVAVISYGYWQQQLGGRADVIGRSVRLNSELFTIVGVTPPEFFGPEVGRTFDFMVPLRTEPLIHGGDSALDAPGTNFLSVIARLKPGQSLDAAMAELRGVQSQIRDATVGPWGRGMPQQAIDRYLRDPFTLVPAATGDSNLRRQFERPLIIMAVVVALVLLIACVNVANLLLARAVARRHELSVRLALGASRWRLARHLFTESLLLAAAGAAVGMLVAAYGSSLLVRQLSTPANTVFLDVSIDGRVLAFTIAITAVTALFFGTAPAFRAARVPPIDALKAQGRTTGEQVHGGLGGWLVVVQVALSVVLVVAAGLFIRSFGSLATRQLGFQPDQVLVVTMDSQQAVREPAERISLYERVREAVLRLPNVAGAAVSFLTPVSGGGLTPPVDVYGASSSKPPREVFGNLISPGWFTTFGTRLAAGRDFSNRDRSGAARVAIVNETFARQFLGSGSALGRRFTLWPGTPRMLTMEIVGVVADAVYTSPHEQVPPTWYVPIAQFDMPGFPWESARLTIRAKSGSPVLLTKSVAGAVATVNPQLALTFQPLATQIHDSLIQERLLAQLAGFFGALALLLAALGLYGVTAYAISRRRIEIGIRMALGAAPTSVIRLVMTRLMLRVGVGIAAGAGLSLWASTFVSGMIYGLPPRDPTTLASAALVLCGVGTLAGWLPARRAARIDPVAVLRES
jgi:putative ABC transport system permease protein